MHLSQASQGLELDFVGLCWGGDLVLDAQQWMTRRFKGSAWQVARGERRRFALNSYRVLLTRAREGLLIWVPRGSHEDPTRPPASYDRVAGFLTECGAEELGASGA